MHVEPYIAPQAVQLFTAPVPPCTGAAVHVCGFDEAGMPHGYGAVQQTGPLVWGEDGTAPADALWQRVTDMGGLQDSGRDAYLWAAYEGGALYLHIGADAPGNGAGADVTNGAGHFVTFDGAGMPHGAGRAVAPDLYLCPMDEREAWLKAADGRWRAWMDWDVLATVFWRVSGAVAADVDSRVMTLWMVFAGNVLCFYTTTEDWNAGGVQVYRARNWAAFGSVVRGYGYDPEDETDGVVSGGFYQAALGGVVPVVLGAASELDGFMNVARLPWQFAGEAAVFDIGDDPAPGLGTLDLVSPHDDAGMPRGTSLTGSLGFAVCPRLHFNSGRTSYSGGAQFTAAQVATILYGGAGDFGTWGGLYTLANGAGGPAVEVVPGFNLLFNPWAVEGLGLYRRGTLDFARVDAQTYLPPVACDWKRLASATLRGPAGDVYVDIAGAETGDCLLTASGSTEYVS